MKLHLLALLGFSFMAGCFSPEGNSPPSPSPSAAAEPTPAPAPAPAPEPRAAAETPPAPADAFPQMSNPLVGTVATNYPPIVAEAFSSVELSDGVDGDEAAVLAEAYFMGYVTGNGMIGEAVDRGDLWEFETFVEYSRTPYNPIQVMKKSGQIICGGGPLVNPPPGPHG